MASNELALHRLTWADFDSIARGDAGARVMANLRRAERSRRLLLLRALVDEATKTPGIAGPLPSPEEAWELLERAENKDPAVVELMITHPYTGTWAGYTMRLLHRHISGVAPLWVHVGHLHSLAAATAIRAGLDFSICVPIYQDGVMLPTLGFARVTAPTSLVAAVTAKHGRVRISHGTGAISVDVRSEEGPNWWGLRRLAACTDGEALKVRLDDLDPYRGLYEPVPAARLDRAEVNQWRALFTDAWQLIVRHLPALAAAFPVGLDSLVPIRPRAPLGVPSASTGEAFGSAIVTLPPDGASLAATLVHEFQHIRLGGLLHLIPLRQDDPRERFYAPWRDDPRPLGGMLQGIFAFFGVADFWRAISRDGPELLLRRAGFEFALWRGAVWRAVTVVRDDPALTPAGRRFLAGIRERLGPWQDEQVATELVRLADQVAADHYAGWRLRHLRPDPYAVQQLAEAWLARPGQPAAVGLGSENLPTPVPDGPWSRARTGLARLRLSDAPVAGRNRARNTDQRAPSQVSVPGATNADVALVAGRYAEAAHGYRAELAADPGRPASWVGLGLALSATGKTPASAILLQRPELVRAVDRRIRAAGGEIPRPDDLSGWIGRSIS